MYIDTPSATHRDRGKDRVVSLILGLGAGGREVKLVLVRKDGIYVWLTKVNSNVYKNAC